MPTRQVRRSRAYLIGIAIGVPSIIGIWLTQRADDDVVGVTYPVLAVYLLGAGWVLRYRPHLTRAVERTTFAAVSLLWLLRLGFELHRGDPVAGWQQVTPWTFITLPLLALLGYVVHDTAAALRRTVLLPLVSSVLSLSALVPAATATGDWSAVIELVRYEVYLMVTMVFVHALALHKDEAARIQLEAERLRLIAHHDSLTGLPNRRYLEEVLERNVASADRAGRPLSVLLFDLDRFKEVNDTHGHAAGDLVLRDVARSVAAHTRPLDAVGRWGGEEFLVVLPDTDREAAVAVAERMRAAVAEGTAAAGVPVTASFGVAQYRSGAAADRVAEADQLLYAAKSSGRDAVRSAWLPAARAPAAGVPLDGAALGTTPGDGGSAGSTGSAGSGVERRDEPAQQP
jgi:diguanylate cyclase (GGDEF)-like protein